MTRWRQDFSVLMRCQTSALFSAVRRCVDIVAIAGVKLVARCDSRNISTLFDGLIVIHLVVND